MREMDIITTEILPLLMFSLMFGMRRSAATPFDRTDLLRRHEFNESTLS